MRCTDLSVTVTDDYVLALAYRTSDDKPRNWHNYDDITSVYRIVKASIILNSYQTDEYIVNSYLEI